VLKAFDPDGQQADATLYFGAGVRFGRSKASH
jgi:hypothetical protein